MLQWDDYDRMDWDKILNASWCANSYLLRKGLIRKANLAQYVQKHCRRYPDSILNKHVPQTVQLQIDPREVEWSLCDADDVLETKEQRESPKLWILKPSVTDSAAEVRVVQTMDEVRDSITRNMDIGDWVLQRYVDRPLLVRGCKFHLRVYVVAFGDLCVYLNTNILSLIAVRKYSTDHTERLSHLTNTCLQMDQESFSETDNIRTLQELVDDGILDSEKTQHSVELMKQVMNDVFSAVRGEFAAFSSVAHCFEMYGIDFLLDQDYNPHLLEVNCGPDFKATGLRLKKLIKDLMADTMYLARTLVVDPQMQIRAGTRSPDATAPTADPPQQYGALQLCHSSVGRQARWGGANVSLS
jgi:tubulin---tyrosine ligase